MKLCHTVNLFLEIISIINTTGLPNGHRNCSVNRNRGYMYMYRHCATSRKVAGSILDCVIWFFHWHNPSGRTTTLGLTQPLREMSTRNVSWG